MWKMSARIALMALTCGVYSLSEVHGAPVRLPRSHEETDEEKADKMFPDGTSHDFGKVPRGTQAKCAFRIVNRSDVPIRIGSISISMGSLTAYATKSDIQPNEEAEIVTVVDTNRFVGARTQTLFVLMETGNKKIIETRFWLKANSQDNSRP
jgi:Protein of unknown function (DUF1573)